MRSRNFITFLVVFLGLLALGWGAFALLRMQDAPTAAWWVGGIGTTLAVLWTLFQLWTIRHFRAAKAATALIVTGLIVAGITLFLFYIDQAFSGIIVASIYAMIASFIVGLWLIRTSLSPGHPITGVARTLIDEAIRMKVALVIIISVLLLVPLLPILTDGEAQLRYRIQTFLTYSLSGMSLLLSLMTIFLACGTICFELKQKQIFLSMTKSVSRFQYLMGKWLGISLLNLLLVAIIGTGVYGFTRSLQQLPANTIEDRIAVDKQLMVARDVRKPSPPAELNLQAQVDERLAKIRAEREQIDGDPIGAKDIQDARMAVWTKWHTIDPGDSATFIFADLDKALEFGPIAQLRLEPNMAQKPADEMARMALWLNGRPFPYDFRRGGHEGTKIAVKTPHVIDIPLAQFRTNEQGQRVANSILAEDGSLTVTIKNTDLQNPGTTPASSISFAPSDGIEVLFIVDTFEANLVRSLSILWLRLVFLAILGLTAGTFCGFPVACLLCLMVYFTAISSSFITDSLGYYAGTAKKTDPLYVVLGTLLRDMVNSIGEGQWDHLAKEFVRFWAELGVALVPSFGEYNPVPKLADGRNVSYGYLGEAVLWVAVIWAGLCAAVGLYIFRRRELARAIA